MGCSPVGFTQGADGKSKHFLTEAVENNSRALLFRATIVSIPFSLRWWNYSGMAIHTAAGLLLLGFGLPAFVKSEGELKWSLGALTTVGFMIGIMSLTAAAGIPCHFTNQLQQSAAWVSLRRRFSRRLRKSRLAWLPLSFVRFLRLANRSSKFQRSPASRSCSVREPSHKKSGEMSRPLSHICRAITELWQMQCHRVSARVTRETTRKIARNGHATSASQSAQQTMQQPANHLAR